MSIRLLPSAGFGRRRRQIFVASRLGLRILQLLAASSTWTDNLFTMSLRIPRALLAAQRQASCSFSTSTIRTQALPSPLAELNLVGHDVQEDGPPTGSRAFQPRYISNPMKVNVPHSGDVQYHLHVKTTRNNAIITLTDEHGHIFPGGTWSGGAMGFKGVNESYPEAAYQCAVRAFARMAELMVKEPNARFAVHFKEKGMGRDAVMRAIMTAEGDKIRSAINMVADNTPIKIGGTKAKKTRRV